MLPDCPRVFRVLIIRSTFLCPRLVVNQRERTNLCIRLDRNRKFRLRKTQPYFNRYTSNSSDFPQHENFDWQFVYIQIWRHIEATSGSERFSTKVIKSGDQVSLYHTAYFHYSNLKYFQSSQVLHQTHWRKPSLLSFLSRWQVNSPKFQISPQTISQNPHYLVDVELSLIKHRL